MPSPSALAIMIVTILADSPRTSVVSYPLELRLEPHLPAPRFLGSFSSLAPGGTSHPLPAPLHPAQPGDHPRLILRPWLPSGASVRSAWTSPDDPITRPH